MHNIAETLIKPCVIDVATALLDKTAVQKLQQVPMSNDTIRSRIVDMSRDVLQQVVENLKTSPTKFSLQLDESTDIACCCQLIAFVRYHDANKETISEEFLFCETLETTARAQDVFEKVTSFFNAHEITLDMLGSICTDGAPAMLGNRSGFAALVKNVAPHVTVTHCILHRHALMMKTLPENLNSAMTLVVRAVNFIRGQPLNQRLFQKFCEEVGSEFTVLLYHTQVRWLSRGRVLRRVVEVYDEVVQFLRHQNSPLADELDSLQTRKQIAYLADVFELLNQLNLSLQGPDVSIIRGQEKLSSFLEKLTLWKNRVENGNFANFATLDSLELDVQEADTIKDDIVHHLTSLQGSFDKYFGRDAFPREGESWIQDPFTFNLNMMNDNDGRKEDLIELRHAESARSAFQSQSLITFWCKLIPLYPNLAKSAVGYFVPFVTSYLCEAGFSTLLDIKTKKRNRLDAVHDMRLALSSAIPRFKVLCSDKKQEHASH